MTVMLGVPIPKHRISAVLPEQTKGLCNNTNKVHIGNIQKVLT